MSNPTAKRLGDGSYEYRGYLIESDDCLPSGYDGKWMSIELRLSSGTLKGLKREIDRFQAKLADGLTRRGL